MPKDDERVTGREAPMIIWPRDVIRLVRQLVDLVRGRRKR